MSKVVKVKAQKFVLSGGGQTDEGYRYQMIPEAYIGPDVFATKIADEMGTPKIIAQAWIDAFARVVTREIMANKVVNPGWCLGQLHVTGSTPTAVTGKLDRKGGHGHVRGNRYQRGMVGADHRAARCEWGRGGGVRAARWSTPTMGWPPKPLPLSLSALNIILILPIIPIPPHHPHPHLPHLHPLPRFPLALHRPMR